MKRRLPDKPGDPVRVEPDSKQERLIVADVNEYMVAGQEAKREVEKEALQAYLAYQSWMDPIKHSWPVPVYDPVLHAAQQTKQAKFADAMFGNGPMAEYMPRKDTSSEQAKALNACVNGYHMKMDRPRRKMCNAFESCSTVGNAFLHIDWAREEREVWYWKRMPIETVWLDPITGQPSPLWIDNGKWKYVRTRKMIKDNNSIKDLHITSVFPDASSEHLQDGEFFCVRSVISHREAQERIKTDQWDKRAVNRALNAELPETASGRISDVFDWQRQIGLQCDDQRISVLEKGKRKDIEVVECFRRTRFGLERIVVLQRSWVAWFGPSPYGHGMFPFVMAKNFAKTGQFWGISDWRIVKWLNRAIQGFLNASVSEAVLNSQPPLLIPEDMEFIGKEYKPRAEWRYSGGTVDQIQFLNRSTGAQQSSQAERMALMERMDAALGSSDPGRGSIDARAKATTVSIATQMQSMRDKYLMDNFGDDTVIPMYEMFAWNTQQFQEYNVQVALSDNPEEEPMTISPDDFRGGDFWVNAQINTAALKELDKKRALEIQQVFQQNPVIDQRHLAEMVLGKMDPNAVDKLLVPEQQQLQQQMQAQGMPGQVQMGGNQSPFSAGDTVQEAAAQLEGAMSV